MTVWKMGANRKPSKRQPGRGITLARAGENRVVAALRAMVPRGRLVRVGIGDDCAVVDAGDPSNELVLTSDPLVEGVHFAADAAPRAVGRKAVERCLSDLAAMGAEPLWALIDVVAPPGFYLERLAAVYAGAVGAARKHGLSIVGGDTARGRVLELHVFAVGRAARGAAVLRSGARPGDAVYVTGRLGGGGDGRRLAFEPRLEQGAWLSRRGWATAMMDISDGLAADLPRLAEASGAGARLAASAIPVSACLRGRPDALERALGDGEDYELLFTVRPGRAAAFERAWRRRFSLRATRIGEIVGRRLGVKLAMPDGGEADIGRGYEHFRGDSA